MNTTVRRIDNNTFDVFTGAGWNNWTRMRTGRSSTFVVAGARLPREVFNYVVELLNPRMPINYELSQENTWNNCQCI